MSKMARLGGIYNNRICILAVIVTYLQILLNVESCMTRDNALAFIVSKSTKMSTPKIVQRNSRQQSFIIDIHTKKVEIMTQPNCSKHHVSDCSDVLWKTLHRGLVSFWLFCFIISGANIANSYESEQVMPIPSIVACEKTELTSKNCVSTASVKQVDLFMSPWVWPNDGSVSVNEIVGRLKGVFASDPTLTLIYSNADDRKENDSYFFRVRAVRNVCIDELELLVNPVEHVILFRSKQVDGPENLSDFGANRRRLDDIRKQLKVVSVLGSDIDTADTATREGISGQLRAFWGLQSGSGYESVLLNEDE